VDQSTNREQSDDYSTDDQSNDDEPAEDNPTNASSEHEHRTGLLQTKLSYGSVHPRLQSRTLLIRNFNFETARFRRARMCGIAGKWGASLLGR